MYFEGIYSGNLVSRKIPSTFAAVFNDEHKIANAFAIVCLVPSVYWVDYETSYDSF